MKGNSVLEGNIVLLLAAISRKGKQNFTEYLI
jgi:hypothetical protein